MKASTLTGFDADPTPAPSTGTAAPVPSLGTSEYPCINWSSKGPEVALISVPPFVAGWVLVVAVAVGTVGLTASVLELSALRDGSTLGSEGIGAAGPVGGTVALVVAAEVVVEGTGGGGLGSGRKNTLDEYRGRSVSLVRRTVDVNNAPVFVAGGTLVAETGTPGAAGESVFVSDVAVGSSWSFFLRLKKPRRPFFTWENASSARND